MEIEIAVYREFTAVLYLLDESAICSSTSFNEPAGQLAPYAYRPQRFIAQLNVSDVRSFHAVVAR
jgi:hypothetical protein